MDIIPELLTYMGMRNMNICIYTRNDDSTTTFNSAEHIIPKSIGGIRCLPKGWVSDEVNNRFSRLELEFSRENPIVAIPRMFVPNMGRKKHKNREKVCVFSYHDNSQISLGYMKNAKPFPLQQVVFTNLTVESIEKEMRIGIILSPSMEYTHEELFRDFWESLKKYNGSPCCIKDKTIPQNTYLLGKQDNKWFLGISDKENAESIKPLIIQAVQKMSVLEPDKVLNGNANMQTSSSQVTASYSIGFNYMDCFRVYAKIAFNSLAYLRGKDYILLPEFDNIRESILTGHNILEYVCISKGENPVKEVINKFPEKLTFGEQFHSIVLLRKGTCLYGIISLFGLDNLVIVKLSEKAPLFEFNFDIYICDWQNHKDYKLIDCVLKICEDENTDY